MIIHKSNYLTIDFIVEKEMFVLDWTNATLTEELYKIEFLAYAKMLETYKPRKVLIDASKSVFIISNHLQEWVNKNIISVAIKNGLKKTAILLTEEFVSRLSIELAFEEDKTQLIQRRYFDNRAQALNWLDE